MAIMTEQQQSLLDQLEEARVVYETFEEALAQEMMDRKWEEKTRIRHLVREARAAGVPFRQIGFALKTSDHKTLKDYHDNVRKDKR